MMITLAWTQLYSDDGQFANVFRSPNGGTVFKLYRRYGRDLEARTTECGEMIARATAKAEILAYEMLKPNDTLREHAPEFRGRYTVAEVVGPSGLSVSDQYLLDCCLALEWLPGERQEVL